MDIRLDSLFLCRRSMVHYDMVTVYLIESLNSVGGPRRKWWLSLPREAQHRLSVSSLMCQSKVIDTSRVGNVDQIVHELDLV